MSMKPQHIHRETYWTFDKSQVKAECAHQECDCFQTVTGRTHQLDGISYKIRYAQMEEDTRKMVEDASARVGWTLTQDLQPQMIDDLYYVATRVTGKDNLKLIPPQTNDRSFPPDMMDVTPNPKLEILAREADLWYWHKKGVILPVSVWTKYIWWRPEQDQQDRDEVPPLWAMILRKHSIYNSAFGKIKGRPQAILASARLYPRKWAETVLIQQRGVANHPAELSEIWQHVQESMDLLYHKMDTDKYKASLVVPLDMEGIDANYLGSSAGNNKGEERTIYFEDDPPLNVSPSGKKLENLESDLESFIDFLEDENADPFCAWDLSQKVEMFYSRTKQLKDEDFEKWINKLRIFVIPSSFYVLMERMVSKVRHMMERGKVIRVGQKWSRGGGQIFAEALGIDETNEWLGQLFEGDIDHFDQSVIAKMVDLYYSQMLYYDLPGTHNYKLRKRIVEWLAKHVVTRVTHLFGELWAISVGGVPSGMINTSHIDSWVMAMYLCMFFTTQIHNAPAHMQDKLMNIAVDLLMMCVYGDDHAVNKTSDEDAKAWFAGTHFVKFMHKYFGVKVRDMNDNMTFLSTEALGILIHKGLTFLRHQFIINPEKDQPKQPRYLPYRETWEFMIRVFWGKEGKVRDFLDIVMSAIGHAYGTYAANRDAYEKLRIIYTLAISRLGRTIPEIMKTLANKVIKEEDTFRDFRRRGVTVEELIAGFPTWETLVKKNEIDRPYHIIQEVYYDVDYEVEV